MFTLNGPPLWLALLALALLPGCSRPTNPPTAVTQAKAPAAPPSIAPTSQTSTESSALSESQTTLRFTLMNGAAGIDHTYKNAAESNQRTILESVGGGGGFFDYDGDGRLDIVFAGGGYFGPRKTLPGHPTAVFRSQGEWKFENVSQVAGNGFASEHFSHGIFAADYDNDGFMDFLVTGFGGLQLWRNQGDGTFEEVHISAGLDDKLWSTGVAWGDLNADGYLDLYVAHYTDWSLNNNPYCPASVPGERETCPPRDFNSLPDTLYFSSGDGTFRDVSREAGLRLDPRGPNGPQELGKGLGVMINDFDLDGDQDIYVANDTVDNFLYLNDGQGKLSEDGVLRGVATDHLGLPNGSMGMDVGDYNHDGLPDLWVANYQHEAFALYRNEGSALFTHVSQLTGITAVGGLYVGFGTVFADLNRDCFEDIVVANGHVLFYPSDAPFRQEPLIHMNQQGKFFRRQRLDSDAYFGKGQTGRGLMAGDLDDDGDVDFCFVNNGDPCGLLRNDSTDDGDWLRVRLIGSASNRGGVGATLTLHTDQGDLLRFVKGASSYVSHCDVRPMWGFPRGTKLLGLSITWPSGTRQKIENLAANQEFTVVEPR